MLPFSHTCHATAFVWASQYVNISGRVSAVFLVAAALGGIANPFIVGYLLDNCGHTSLPYYVTALTATFLITYLTLHVFVRYRNRKNENPERASQSDVRGLPKQTEMTVFHCCYFSVATVLCYCCVVVLLLLCDLCCLIVVVTVAFNSLLSLCWCGCVGLFLWCGHLASLSCVVLLCCCG